MLSFERVGIARYARCERLLAAAPAALGDRWEDLPAELRGRWIRMLTHCRRARLLAYRVVSLQNTGRIQPGDAAAYRIAVTKLDQDSAEVLMDIAAEVSHDDPGGRLVPRRDRRPLEVLAGVHGVLRQHRDAAHSVVPRTAGGDQMSEMNLDLGDDAKEYGRQALRAFDAAGGDQLVQQAEAKPDIRESLVGPVLNELGAWELDARTDADGLEAAAALCRSAGYWALPYPVAERLAKPTDLDSDGLIVVASNRPAGAVGGVETRWTAVTVDGVRSLVVGHGATGAAFVTPLELEEIDRSGAGDVALALTLPCWTLLGMLDRAIELTIAHVTLRKQFGQPLSAFQSVQFQLTDAEVERSGLDILAKYALWSIGSGKPEALVDALALRMSAIEAAEVVFRVCHQLHGAVGFCDETTLSWLSRYSQPLRRLPLGLSATRAELTRRAGRSGLTGLYA